MDIGAWAERKRAEQRLLGPVDIRNITPSIRDFTHAVSTRKSAIAVIAPVAAGLSGPDLARCVEVLDEVGVSAIALQADPGERSADASPALSASHLPVVHDDLVVTREQVYRARLAHADAVLLTAAAVSAAELKALIGIAASMHMAAPVWVRTADELQAAVRAGARLLVVDSPNPGALSEPQLARLVAEAPKNDALIVRGHIAGPPDLLPLRGRADAAWLTQSISASDAGADLRTLVEAAESG